MNNRIFDIKIYEDDLLNIEAIILDHIRNMKVQLYGGELTEEGNKLIKQMIENDKALLEKLKICRLYNFDTKEKEIYKND
jgi:hypothetical protein